MTRGEPRVRRYISSRLAVAFCLVGLTFGCTGQMNGEGLDGLTPDRGAAPEGRGGGGGGDSGGGGGAVLDLGGWSLGDVGGPGVGSGGDMGAGVADDVGVGADMGVAADDMAVVDPVPDMAPPVRDGCSPGFVDDGMGGCRPEQPGEPATRTVAEVCQRWKGWSPRASLADLFAVAPKDTCDPGVLSAEALDDALSRLNLYRWLVGLEPVAGDSDLERVTQACATTLAAARMGLTHQIPTSYPCYTQEAAQAAGSSNLSSGRSMPWESVDGYVRDRNVRSLGHRRWLFNPPLGKTGFGHRDRYSCMAVFDMSNPGPHPDAVPYPSAGPFPRAALLGPWMLGSQTLGFHSDSTVRITRVSDGSAIAVDDVYVPTVGYGVGALAWHVDTASVPAGEELEVVISGLGRAKTGSYTWRTTIVDCP